MITNEQHQAIMDELDKIEDEIASTTRLIEGLCNESEDAEEEEDDNEEEEIDDNATSTLLMNSIFRRTELMGKRKELLNILDAEKTLTIPNVEKIADNAYDGRYFKAIIIPNTVKEIGWQGIARCENISELSIPDSVQKIGYLFCCDSPLLERVIFHGRCPEGLERAFENCPNLKTISVPEQYKDVYREAMPLLADIIVSE